MKISVTAFLATSTLLLMIACNDRRAIGIVSEDIAMSKTKEEETGNFHAQNEIAADTLVPNRGTSSFKPVVNNNRNTDWEKKIIKTATLVMEVKNYNGFNKNLRDKMQQAGGYVAQEEQTQSEYKIQNSLVIKVPVENFDQALTLIATGDDKLLEKRITSEDVTGEFVDTKSRIEAKRNIRLRYMDLLKQAKNMEDILKVQQEINEIQEEMEAGQGRVEYLGHASAYSTINLTCFQILNPTVHPDADPSFLLQVKNAFVNGGKWMAELTIALISIWPLWIVILFSYLIYKRWRTPKVKSA